MDKFRQELLSKPPPKILKNLTVTITPPKGVRRKSSENEENKPQTKAKGWNYSIATVKNLPKKRKSQRKKSTSTTPMTRISSLQLKRLRASRETIDIEIAKKVLHSLVDQVIEIEQRNPFPVSYTHLTLPTIYSV